MRSQRGRGHDAEVRPGVEKSEARGQRKQRRQRGTHSDMQDGGHDGGGGHGHGQVLRPSNGQHTWRSGNRSGSHARGEAAPPRGQFGSPGSLMTRGASASEQAPARKGMPAVQSRRRREGRAARCMTRPDLPQPDTGPATLHRQKLIITGTPASISSRAHPRLATGHAVCACRLVVTCHGPGVIRATSYCSPCSGTCAAVIW